jgi:hypothetical protein
MFDLSLDVEPFGRRECLSIGSVDSGSKGLKAPFWVALYRVNDIHCPNSYERSSTHGVLSQTRPRVTVFDCASVVSAVAATRALNGMRDKPSISLPSSAPSVVGQLYSLVRPGLLREDRQPLLLEQEMPHSEWQFAILSPLRRLSYALMLKGGL